jgi:putative phage-type endonuclease
MHEKVAELLQRCYDEQRTPEWHALRGTMLTASDLATAIGDNPYETPDDLIVKKCGFRQWNGNSATAHGTLLEPIARDLYDDRHNQKSHEIGLVQHPVHKWLGGSPDGVTESGRLIEIKCPLTRKITPAVPKYYLPQIQLLLEVLDLEVCDFIQYRPASEKSIEEFVVTQVHRDREWFERILPTAKAFWDRVIQKRLTGMCEVILDEEAKEYICEVLEDDEVPGVPAEQTGDTVDVPGMP